MKVITTNTNIHEQIPKSPASLSPTEKIQLLEEMGINAYGFYGISFVDGGMNKFTKLTLAEYIEEMK